MMEPEKGSGAATAGAPQPQPSVHYHYYGMQYPAYWYYSPTQCYPKPRRSRKPSVAGFILIFAGIFAIISGAFFGAFALGVGPMWTMMDNSANTSSNTLVNIQGQVIFLNSTPAVGVNVTIVDLSITAQTNSTGHYKILNVPQGWHDLRVDYLGYKSLIQSVEVSTDMVGMGSSGQGSQGMEWKDYVTTDFQLQSGSGEVRIGTAHDTGPIDNGWETTGKAFMQSLGAVCLVAAIIGGTFMLLGGYFAIKRTKLPLVIVGSVFAIIFCSILGIIAIILVLLSTNEFDKKDKEEGDGGDRKTGGHGGPPEAPKPTPERKPDLNAPTTKAPEKVSPANVGAPFPAMTYVPYPGPQYYTRQY